VKTAYATENKKLGNLLSLGEREKPVLTVSNIVNAWDLGVNPTLT
jgi:hypothetical protein